MSDLEERFSDALHSTSRSWRQAVDRRLKYLGVSQASWMTIAIAAKARSPLSQSELADRLGVEGATMVAMIDRLVKAGLANREASTTDRRVKRVVLTSSVAAASPRASARESVSDETVWTDLDDPKVSAYARSKTLAERAAWDQIRASGGATTLATVNPVVVLGPVLSRDYSASVQLVERLLSGRAPGLPRLGFSIVDVRDVADLHIRAMIAPEAAGQRFIAASDFAWLADVAALLRARLGEAANKVPTRKVPDFVLRLAALFDKSLAAVAPRLGERRTFSSAKAQKMLGWRPRPLEETVLDCARSLIATGAV